MSDRQFFLDPAKPASFRLAPDEIDFINENYEYIAETPEWVSQRVFFFTAVQKAVSRIAPKVPAVDITPYTGEIETLKAQLQEALTDIENKTAFIDEITRKNVELDQESYRLAERINELNEQLTGINKEALQHEQALEAACRVKEGTLILEDMLPVEIALINEYAKMMQTTPKAVLVEKLFTPTVWHGPGDYIPRLTGAAKRKIREAFE
jgi:hypothetical protein